MILAASTLALASLTSVDLPPRVRTRYLTEICNVSTDKFRRVSKKLKSEIYARDGHFGEEHSGKYVVDHIIPLQLGGSNDPSNLMLQNIKGECNSKDKDKLERKLHEMACSYAIDLTKAQDEIYSDWISAYKLYVSESGCKR